ncbi:MAG: excinuclease ABC subunit UvrC [Candidatus Omnitrophica bacterium]|nr:excinuclease ABC subunit UvrC [Candidatus Omnitrophota bacterium]
METDIKEKVKALPTTSGVYLMKNVEGKIIYIGKAINLRKRVQSYFRASSSQLSKTDLLVADIRDIDYIPTLSEAEALILEAGLIKKHAPRYNIDLRDDKSYPYIEIKPSVTPGVTEGYSKILVTRPREKLKGSIYYGPYVNVSLVREALNLLRKIFPYCNKINCGNKECLDYHMGLCPAPCAGKISAKDYQDNIKNICLVLDGEKDALYRRLQKKMAELGEKKEYEEAAKVRDQLRAVSALYSGSASLNFYKEAEQLQRTLELPRLPERIEAFDISNIMGNQPVGSMVSFLNGKPYKSNYRKFKIKTVEGIDDFQMMAEVVYRRYKRLKIEHKIFPDLILIDGGKGQLAAAEAELKKLEVEIPIASLAKKEEEIFLPRRRNSIKLAKDSLALHLLQRVRDEAHRFAVTFHRLRRRKVSLSMSRGNK